MPPAPLRRVDSGLDQPGAVDALLRSAGLRPERIWHDRLHHEWDRSSFWELASGSGSNRIRLSQLGSAARAGVLARLTSTLSQLGPGDFVWEGEVICAVATKHSFGTDHPGKEPLPGARPIWNSLMAASGARRRSFLQCGIQRQATPAGWPSITAVGGRLSRVLRAAGSYGSSVTTWLQGPQGRIFIHRRSRGECPASAAYRALRQA